MSFGKFKKIKPMIIGGKHGKAPILTEEQKEQIKRQKEIVSQAKANAIRKIKDDYGFNILL